MKPARYFLLIPIVLLLHCSGDSSTTSFDTPSTYFSTMQKATLSVFYETGAAPFVGSFSAALPAPLKSRNYWDITRENLKAMFETRSLVVEFTVPDTLEAMTEIPAQDQAGWTADELKALWEVRRPAVSTTTEGQFFIAFLDGHFESEGTLQTQVIGVHIGGTPMIALFKRVIESTGTNPEGAVPKFVEQSTLVHEMGHLLGLVNRGIPLASAHHDEANGAHCTNTSCSMYYQNEGLTSAVAFAQGAVASGSLVILGSECLNDSRSYKP